MARADLALRDALARDGSLFQGYHPRMAALHQRHGTRLAALIDAHGWPGRSRVGAASARAAWLILQHAIANPPLMRRGLTLLQGGASEGEVSPLEVAMLEDRIRTFEGRPQRYGTQFDWDEHGRLSPLPLEDPAGGVARRLLSDREVDALQHRARRVSHLDVPGSGPIGRHRLAAPRAPGRPAHLQLDVAHLRVAVEPHVVDARATGALHLGPADQLGDIRREGGAGVLRLPVQDRPRDHRIDDRHLRRSEEHTSELQSPCNLVCRLLL